MATVTATAQDPRRPLVQVWRWADVYARLAEAPAGEPLGIPRGGQIVAGLTGRAVDTLDEADVIVEDILDSGATQARLCPAHDKPLWALITKQAGDRVDSPPLGRPTIPRRISRIRCAVNWNGSAKTPRGKGCARPPSGC